MTSCQYPAPSPDRDRMYQHKVSLVVRYFMIPCNICLILLATSTLGFAVLLFLNNYKPVHFTPAQPPDGCRGMLCGFGAVCERDPADPSKGECVCKKTCPPVVAPVCGSDSSTYSNECELEKAQCATQRRLKVVRKGSCAKDPCSEVTCSYGSTCIQSSDGQSAKCVCPLSCEQEPQRKVCGSDGQDYPSECQLNQHACRLQKNIRKEHDGPCDPCEDSRSNPNVACRVEPRTRRPQTFASPESCPADREPVCASDGQTYDNKCRMERTGKLQGLELKALHAGRCRKEDECQEGCQFNAVCQVQRSGPRCSCEAIQCDGAYRPLCSTDGRTFGNDCERRRAECQARARIPVKQQGPCGLHTPSPCQDKPCGFGAACVVRNGEPVCECPDACPKVHDPVCGDDEHTYGSQCEMKAMGCVLQREIRIRHKGPCGSFRNQVLLRFDLSPRAAALGVHLRLFSPTLRPLGVFSWLAPSRRPRVRALAGAPPRPLTARRSRFLPPAEPCSSCRFGAICDTETGRCVCPTECVASHQPVCGTDGATYANECELNVQACTQQKDLRVAAQGECKTCGDAVCSWGAMCVRNQCVCPSCAGQPSAPVCGSDGVTYDSACILRAASCHLRKKIDIARTGPCDEECGSSGGSGSGEDSACEQERCKKFGGSWDEDAEDDRCVCDFTCQSVPRSQVCGTDGRSYSSECELKKTRCEKQAHVEIHSQGPCAATSSTAAPTAAAQHCSQAVYGCCLDNTTVALGVGLAGCPSTCLCNSYGSYGGSCDPTTGQCSCKPGVGGPKCDRCEPGFWNFRGIVTDNMSGCTPCNCDPTGSVRDDCEQMTGLCSCKTGVTGMKCTLCLDGSTSCEKGPAGQASCAALQCQFGATCAEVNGKAQCECPPPDCAEKNRTKVCGSDGVTYADQCQLRTIACRQATAISVKHVGQCSVDGLALRPAPWLPGVAREYCCYSRYSLLPTGSPNPAAGGERSAQRERPGSATVPSPQGTALVPGQCQAHAVTRSEVSCGETWLAAARRHPHVAHMGPAGEGLCLLPRGWTAPGAVGQNPIRDTPSVDAFSSSSRAVQLCSVPPHPVFGRVPEGAGCTVLSPPDVPQGLAACVACRVVFLLMISRGFCQSPIPGLRSGSAGVLTLCVPLPEPAESTTALPAPEDRSSCDNAPFGCCPDSRTAASDSEGTNCPIPSAPSNLSENWDTRQGNSKPSCHDNRPTMKFSGFLHLEEVEGQEVFYTPEMDDPKSELFGETARSIESACCVNEGKLSLTALRTNPAAKPSAPRDSRLKPAPLLSSFLCLRFCVPAGLKGNITIIQAGLSPFSLSLSCLNELFRKSDVQKDFKSVRVRSLAPSSSILAFVEAHFDPDTQYTVEDVENALLTQLKASKTKAISVKKPEKDNIRFNNFAQWLDGHSWLPPAVNLMLCPPGLVSLPFFTTTATTTATVTMPTTTTPLPTASVTTRRPSTTSRATTRRTYSNRRTTTAAPATARHHPTTTTPPIPSSTSPPLTTPPVRARLVPQPKKPPRPCESHPCRHGGTCEEDGRDFTCICPAGRGGAVCEKVIRYYIPSFGGKSYLAFTTMKAYHTMRIAMEFRASELNGLLLFNGQNGRKDFVSLALVSGFVELRFNTGSGTGVLTSRVRVELGKWHQVVVTRNRRSAMLSVDSEPHVTGESPPGTDGLNLDTDLFIGGVPEELLADGRGGLAKGQQGSRVTPRHARFSDGTLSLRKGKAHTANRQLLQSSSGASQQSRLQLRPSGHVCPVCTVLNEQLLALENARARGVRRGKTRSSEGRRARESQVCLEPADSTLVCVRERTSASVGLVGCVRALDVNNLLYNLQENGGEVLYGSGVGECGNNPCLPNPCRNGASCLAKEAEMFHCKCVHGFSGPTCADAHNPCEPNRCHPSAQCQVLPEGGYKCVCPMGREGAHCERESRSGASETFMPFFNGDSYLELKGLQSYGHDLQQKVSLTLVFLAKDPNGMIFYNGQKTDGKGDFISLALSDGFLEFRYDLGKGPAVIRSKERIKMDVWNTVSLERASRKGEINVNDKDRVRGESPNQHTALNLKDSLFIGGAPDFSRLARAAALKDGFKGAITLMGTPILKRANALNSVDISMYQQHPCSQNVCQNGGLCRPLLESYECVCQHGFTGGRCENAIIEKSAGEVEAIAFDGRTFLEYHNAVTKSQLTNEIPDPEALEVPSDQSEKALLVNRFELSIKTEATHGLLLWSGKGVERSDYIALALVDGRVQMTYDLGSKPVVLQSTVRVNTNRWVRIKASRALRDGSLQVDNEAPVTGSSPLAATQLDTDGTLWLGGLEQLAVARKLPKAYSTGFVGCVKDVVVDGLELHLVEDALNSPKILHCSAK
ncbi:AGRIN protein, partial [Atractosteus spatula]|nr:AGRIN protein [Atractosteus spatula]